MLDVWEILLRAMNRLRFLCAVAACALLSACAAMEEENSSPTPIPPAAPDPFGGNFGSNAPNPAVQNPPLESR